MNSATRLTDPENCKLETVNCYAYCPGCAFGIEINNFRREAGKIYAEFRDEQGRCYYCAHGVKRTTAWLKRELADAEVYLASSKRVGDEVAESFYLNQIARCREALDLDVEPTQPQGSLF